MCDTNENQHDIEFFSAFHIWDLPWVVVEDIILPQLNSREIENLLLAMDMGYDTRGRNHIPFNMMYRSDDMLLIGKARQYMYTLIQRYTTRAIEKREYLKQEHFSGFHDYLSVYQRILEDYVGKLHDWYVDVGHPEEIGTMMRNGNNYDINSILRHVHASSPIVSQNDDDDDDDDDEITNIDNDIGREKIIQIYQDILLKWRDSVDIVGGTVFVLEHSIALNRKHLPYNVEWNTDDEYQSCVYPMDDVLRHYVGLNTLDMNHFNLEEENRSSSKDTIVDNDNLPRVVPEFFYVYTLCCEMVKGIQRHHPTFIFHIRFSSPPVSCSGDDDGDDDIIPTYKLELRCDILSPNFTIQRSVSTHCENIANGNVCMDFVSSTTQSIHTDNDNIHKDHDDTLLFQQQGIRFEAKKKNKGRTSLDTKSTHDTFNTTIQQQRRRRQHQFHITQQQQQSLVSNKPLIQSFSYRNHTNTYYPQIEFNNQDYTRNKNYNQFPLDRILFGTQWKEHYHILIPEIQTSLTISNILEQYHRLSDALCSYLETKDVLYFDSSGIRLGRLLQDKLDHVVGIYADLLDDPKNRALNTPSWVLERSFSLYQNTFEINNENTHTTTDDVVSIHLDHKHERISILDTNITVRAINKEEKGEEEEEEENDNFDRDDIPMKQNTWDIQTKPIECVNLKLKISCLLVLIPDFVIRVYGKPMLTLMWQLLLDKMYTRISTDHKRLYFYRQDPDISGKYIKIPSTSNAEYLGKWNTFKDWCGNDTRESQKLFYTHGRAREAFSLLSNYLERECYNDMVELVLYDNCQDIFFSAKRGLFCNTQYTVVPWVTLTTHLNTVVLQRGDSIIDITQTRIHNTDKYTSLPDDDIHDYQTILYKHSQLLLHLALCNFLMLRVIIENICPSEWYVREFQNTQHNENLSNTRFGHYHRHDQMRWPKLTLVRTLSLTDPCDLQNFARALVSFSQNMMP